MFHCFFSDWISLPTIYYFFFVCFCCLSNRSTTRIEAIINHNAHTWTGVNSTLRKVNSFSRRRRRPRNDSIFPLLRANNEHEIFKLLFTMFQMFQIKATNNFVVVVVENWVAIIVSENSFKLNLDLFSSICCCWLCVYFKLSSVLQQWVPLSAIVEISRLQFSIFFLGSFVPSLFLLLLDWRPSLRGEWVSECKTTKIQKISQRKTATATSSIVQTSKRGFFFGILYEIWISIKRETRFISLFYINFKWQRRRRRRRRQRRILSLICYAFYLLSFYILFFSALCCRELPKVGCFSCPIICIFFVFKWAEEKR